MKKLLISVLTFALTIATFSQSEAFQVGYGLKRVKDKGPVCPLCSVIFSEAFSLVIFFGSDWIFSFLMLYLQ